MGLTVDDFAEASLLKDAFRFVNAVDDEVTLFRLVETAETNDVPNPAAAVPSDEQFEYRFRYSLRRYDYDCAIGASRCQRDGAMGITDGHTGAGRGIIDQAGQHSGCPVFARVPRQVHQLAEGISIWGVEEDSHARWTWLTDLTPGNRGITGSGVYSKVDVFSTFFAEGRG
tara:strand:+ start:1592 stop:2104 length:513 start_codon:yes stop_codon:yes gene_type:complete